MKTNRRNWNPKPRFRKCSHCGENFQVPVLYCDGKPSKYSAKNNCSDKCTNAQRAEAIDYQSADRNSKLSEAAKAHMWHKQIHTEESRMKAHRSIRKLADEFSKKRANVLMNGNSALGNDSRRRRITFVAPNGDYYKTWNIAHFVREHEGLFLQEDVAWRVKVRKDARRTGETMGTKYCKAVGGLQALARGKNGVWKGWTLLSNTTRRIEKHHAGGLTAAQTYD